MFKSKTHETIFNNAIKEVDSDNFASQAIIYLLTSETTLWGKVKKHFKDGYIDVLALHPILGKQTASLEFYCRVCFVCGSYRRFCVY